MASVIEQLSNAVVLLLEQGEAAGAFSKAIATERQYDTELALEDTDVVSVIVLPTISKRWRESNGTYRRGVRLEVIVRKRFPQSEFNEAGGVERASVDEYVDLLEQVENYLAHPDNQVPFALTNAEFIEPGDKDTDKELTRNLGVHWLTEHLQTMHQFTGVVRVAYEVTEAY
jgi:hypothetical protein